MSELLTVLTLSIMASPINQRAGRCVRACACAVCAVCVCAGRRGVRGRRARARGNARVLQKPDRLVHGVQSRVANNEPTAVEPEITEERKMN
jgi:hypothetical protein